MKKSTLRKIQETNEGRESALSAHACRSSDGIRRVPEENPGAEMRPAFFHDTDRIMHSKAYTRYIDKTQVFYFFENDHVSKRSLHVQFVSKIGRTIGRALGLNEDLIESISLGHDIGHPPCGHEGERYLDEICRQNKIGCYCHNAQSVRFLSEIENRGRGLNLTLQTLDGILCHNGEILDEKYAPDYKKDWARHLEEYSLCMTRRGHSARLRPMTLEGCAMRISDVIAYIGRDIEDAITIGLIDRGDIPASARRVLGETNREIINGLVCDLIENSAGRPHLMFSPRVFKALNELKDFNYRKIYQDEHIKTQSGKIRNIYEMLFRRYADALRKKDTSSPVWSGFLAKLEGSPYFEGSSPERMAVDFIAGMTDDYFIGQFKEEFLPQSFGSSITNNAMRQAAKRKKTR